MTTLKKIAKVPYTPAQMYLIARNIAEYPEFIPWCKQAVINRQDQRALDATVLGEKFGFNFQASVIYYLQENNRIVVNIPYKGPFQRLEGVFTFNTIQEDGCQFGFDLDFELGNRLLSWTLTPLIKNEANNFFNAFIKRAKDIYF